MEDNTTPVSDDSKDKKRKVLAFVVSHDRAVTFVVACLSETIGTASIHRQEDEGFKFNPSIGLLWVWSVCIGDLSLIILLAI